MHADDMPTRTKADHHVADAATALFSSPVPPDRKRFLSDLPTTLATDGQRPL